MRADVADIDRRQAYLHLQEAKSQLFEVYLYLTSDGRHEEAACAMGLRQQLDNLQQTIEQPGD